MKKIRSTVIVLFILCDFLFVKAQTGFTYKVIDQKTAPTADIDFSASLPDYEPKLTCIQAVKPSSQTELQKNKSLLDAQRKQFVNTLAANSNSFNKTAAPQPLLLKDFFGNTSQGTPNDNDIAVSNSGSFIMSATNTNYNMYNDTGKFLSGRTLASIANQLGALNRTFDPRVIYDPVHDRFIAVFLQGSTHDDTRAIVGFSKTEDPTKLWKFYALPGNIWGDSSWSDYPIISLTKNELFLTLNRVKDNTPWQTGFIESVIWQMSTAEGYAGDSLPQKIYTNIKYNNKSIWSICPAKGGADLYGPNMYFVSLRPSDLSNDTVFLHEVTNTIASGKATLTLKVLKADQTYGLQPNAIQPSGELLQTNDARVLSAMYEDDKIQFVGNSIYKPNFSPGFYHGVIDFVANNPVVKAQTIGYDTMDIGYPCIAYAGSKGDNNSAMITFSYVSKTLFPGTAAMFVDRNRNYSSATVIKTGLTSINMLTDTLERWGDYTGIQRKNNELGIFWLNGSFGTGNNNNTWIGKIKSMDPRLGIDIKTNNISGTIVYPNPVKQFADVEFELKTSTWLTFDIMDMQGRLVSHLLRDKAKAGVNRFSISTNDLDNGIYFIQILQDDKVLISKKFLVAH